MDLSPALLDLLCDRLSRRDRIVYRVALQALSTVEYRLFSSPQVVHRLARLGYRLTKSDASKSLRRLVARGYLDRGPNQANGRRTYLLRAIRDSECAELPTPRKVS